MVLLNTIKVWEEELNVFLKYIELWDEVFDVELFHDDYMGFDYQA